MGCTAQAKTALEFEQEFDSAYQRATQNGEEALTKEKAYQMLKQLNAQFTVESFKQALQILGDSKTVTRDQFRQLYYVASSPTDSQEHIIFYSLDTDMDQKITAEQFLKTIIPLRLTVEMGVAKQEVQNVAPEGPITYEQYQQILENLRSK